MDTLIDICVQCHGIWCVFYAMTVCVCVCVCVCLCVSVRVCVCVCLLDILQCIIKELKPDLGEKCKAHIDLFAGITLGIFFFFLKIRSDYLYAQ